MFFIMKRSLSSIHMKNKIQQGVNTLTIVKKIKEERNI